MEKAKLALPGDAYTIIFIAFREYHSQTETRERSGSHYADGEEYTVRTWQLKWKGIVSLTCRKSHEYFRINFETFEVNERNGLAIADHSFEGLIFYGIEKASIADIGLFTDYLGEEIKKFISKRIKQRDKGLTGITLQFKREGYDKNLLLEKGILLDEGNQARLALVEA